MHFYGGIMKRSRLKLFKATSMTISILGIIMIIVAVVVIAGLGVYIFIAPIFSNPDTGTAYDELAALKSDYSALDQQVQDIKPQVYGSGNKQIKKDYVAAELDALKAKSAIDDVESALTTDQPIDEVNNRIYIAQNQMQKAKTSLSKVRGEI